MTDTNDQFRDTALELRIISYLIRKDYKLCDNLRRDLFSIKAYKLFFDIVQTHRTTFPRDMFKELIQERVKKIEIINPYIIKLFKCRIDNISSKNIAVMIKKINKLFYLRFSMEKTENILECIDKQDIESVKKIARQISSMDITRKRIYTGEYLKDYEERKAIIKTRMEQPNVGVPTGVKKFDDASGGVMKGELAIIISESGMGKSIGLENFGLYAWEEGFNVAYFSYEMSKDQVGFRADSRLMRLKYTNFRLGKFTDEQLLKWEKGIQKYRKTKKNFFEIISLPRSSTVAEMENEADRIQDQHGKKIDVIIADYLNIMRPNNSNLGSTRSWESQVEIAWNLKEVATDFQEEGIAIWSGNQITDEAEGLSILKKKHVKYGRGIVEVANIVVGLVQDKDDEFENIMRLQSIKMRDLKIIDPIILRPNFDMMCLDDEFRRESEGSLKGKPSALRKKNKIKVKE